MLVLIDGHNLIGQLSGISLADANDEDRLILLLRQYRARTGRSITVVFDPGPVYKPASKRKQGGITIQYAPFKKTADDVIINRLRRAKNPRQIMVVTSDKKIQRIAAQVRAVVTSSAKFAQALDFTSVPSTDSPDNVHLSDKEVEEWLNLFNQKKPPGSTP